MKLIVIKAFIACSVCVLAQMPRGFGLTSFVLLQQEDVRKELGLTPAQIKDVEAVLAPLYRDAPNGQRGIFLRRDTNVQEIQARATRSFSEAQKKRLVQIQLWERGGRILLDPEIANKLKLTPKQIKAIDAINAEMNEELRGQIGPRGGQITIRSEFANKYGDRMLQVLTPEQRRSFDQMRGKPFKGAGK